MTLGQKLKKLRTEKNLTQKELADRLHVTFQTVSKWENDTNEPDLATIKELAKTYDVSIEYFFNEEEAKPKKEEETTINVVPVAPAAPAAPQVIIQKEMHVCVRCKKDIPEGELAIDKVEHKEYHGRSSSVFYTNEYYHKSCLEQTIKERKALEKKKFDAELSGKKKKCWGWAIGVGIPAMVLFLLIFLIGGRNDLHPALGVLYGIILGYAVFADIYCIISGSYISDVFLSVASWSVRFPGIIFTFDLEGFAFLIVMKLLFAVLGFFISVAVFLLACILSAAFAVVSFPFVVIHNHRNNYSDIL